MKSPTAAVAAVDIAAAEIRLKVAELIRKIESQRAPCDAVPATLTVTEISFAEGEQCPSAAANPRQPSLAEWNGRQLPLSVCWRVRRDGEKEGIFLKADLGKPVENGELAKLMDPLFQIKLQGAPEYRSSQNFDIFPTVAACRGGGQPARTGYFEESKIKAQTASACSAVRIRQGTEIISDCAQGEVDEGKLVFKLTQLAGRVKPRLVVIDNGDELHNTGMVFDTVREWAKGFRERVSRKQATGIDLLLARGDGTVTPLVKVDEWTRLPESAPAGQDSLTLRLNMMSFNAGNGRVAAVFRSINTQYKDGLSSLLFITGRSPAENDGVDDLSMMYGLKKYYPVSVMSTEGSCKLWTSQVEIPCQQLNKSAIAEQLGRLGGP